MPTDSVPILSSQPSADRPVPIKPVASTTMEDYHNNQKLVPTAATAAATTAVTSALLDKLTTQRSFSRGLRAPANPVAKPPRSFADLRTANSGVDQSKANVGAAAGADWLAQISASSIPRTDQSQAALGTAAPDADWLVQISGSSIIGQPTASQRPGTARKWVKNMPPAVKSAPGVGMANVGEILEPKLVVTEEEEEEFVAVRPKPDAAACLEQLKSSTKSILDQHRSAICRSVGDPDADSQDPYVFGPPGSGSVSQRYGSESWSGSFPFLIKVLSGLKLNACKIKF